MSQQSGLTWGIGFAPASDAVLEQLLQAGVVNGLLQPGAGETSGQLLALHWQSAQAFVAVGACGLVVRLIAPLLQGKEHDPAVVVVDPLGRFAIPLLGGHGAGGEQLGQRLAAVLGAEVVLSGSSSGLGRLPLDSFGRALGWRRGGGDWSALMQRAARLAAAAEGVEVGVGVGVEVGVEVVQESGSHLWRSLKAAAGLRAVEPGQDQSHPPGAADLVISHRLGPGCRWHPPCLWLGLGCERQPGPSRWLITRSAAPGGWV
ncbi:MAG: hypothetical protein R6W06_00845 [Prochlorococcaceae cyanobacterium]